MQNGSRKRKVTAAQRRSNWGCIDSSMRFRNFLKVHRISCFLLGVLSLLVMSFLVFLASSWTGYRYNNKKPTNWWCWEKRHASQLYNFGKLLVILRQRRYASRVVLLTFVQHLITFCSWHEAASDVISGRFVRLAVPDKCIKFHDFRLNHSQEIPVVGCGISTIFRQNAKAFCPIVIGSVGRRRRSCRS